MTSEPSGYRTDALDPQRIFGDVPADRVIGSRGEVLAVVESTMDTARQRAEAGGRDGYAILAEKQRTGRGRKGEWLCPPREGILMSVVLRLGVRAGERRLLGLMGAVAAAEAVQSFGPEARIKWPNDVVVVAKTARLKLRKLGGVLVEPVEQGDSVPAHVLGVGINANQDHRHLPGGAGLRPTSVKIERTGRPVDRNELCRILLERLDHWYGKLRSNQAEGLLARWRTLSCLLGRSVRAQVQKRIVEGDVIGLRATGELILRTRTGKEMLLASERTTLLFGGPGR